MARPPERGGEISDEILDLFERALQLRAIGAGDDDTDEALRDELIAADKRLAWTLLPGIWPDWGPDCRQASGLPSGRRGCRRYLSMRLSAALAGSRSLSP
jgi:hypothetical protein